MIDTRTAAVLQEIVRRESRSFLQYVRESYPWTTPEERDALDKLQNLIDEELQAAGALGRFLYQNHAGLPYLGTYPSCFTSLSFVSLDHLLPMLVDEQRRAAAQLEIDLHKLTDAEARAQVQKTLDMKRRHLTTLESLAAVHPQPVAR